MKKQYSLRIAFIAMLLCVSMSGFGQILAWQFNAAPLSGRDLTYNATTNDANLEISIITRGSGAPANATVSNAFVSIMTASADKASAITNNAYFQFTVKAKAGYYASLTDLDVSFRISDATLAAHFYQFQYSLDGTSFTDIGSAVTLTDINANGVFQPTIDLTTFNNLKNVPSSTTITFRVYAWGGSTGSFGFGKSGTTEAATLFIGGVVTNAVATVSSNPKIIGWDLSAYNTATPTPATINATTTDTNLDAPVLSRGAGLTVPAAYNFAYVSSTPTLSGSSKTLAKTNNEYFQLSIPPKVGYCVSLSTLKYRYRTYASGPINYRWAYSIDGGSTFTEIGSDGVHTASTGGLDYQIDLSGVNALQNNSSTVLLRMYVWGATISNSFGFGRILSSSSTGAPINTIYLRGTTAKVNSAGQLLAWQFNTSNNSKAAFLNATTNNESLEQSVLTRGTGAPAYGSSTYSFVGALAISADKAEAIANNAYYQFQVKPKSGSYVSLTDLDLNIRIQTYSAKTYQFRYSIDGTNFTDIGSPVTLTDENNNGVFQPTVDLAAYADLKNVSSAQTITIRLYAWGGTTPAVGSETLTNFGFGKSLTADVPTLMVGGLVSNSPTTVSNNSKIAGWEFSGLSGTTSGTVNTTSNNVNLDVPVLSRGAGLTAANLNFSYASVSSVLSSTKESAKTNNEYFQLLIHPKSGYTSSFSTLKYVFRTYSTGATNYRWAYSIDNGANFIEIGNSDGTSVVAPGGNEYQVDLSAIPALQRVGTNVILRMYVWGATLGNSIFGFGRYLASSSTGSQINCLYLRGKVEEATYSIANTVNASSLENCPTCDVTVSNVGELNIDATKTFNSVTVAAGGKLTNAPGSTLSTSTLNLNSDATGTATFIDNGTSNITTATVQQYLTTGRNWYVSIPVSTAASSALSSASSVVCWDETIGDWAAPNLSTLNPARGYISVNTTSTGTVAFNGTLNNGEKYVDLTRTPGKTKEGFNLVGNPYPSYLDWKKVYDYTPDAGVTYPNRTIMPTPTMWYKTKTTSYVFWTVNGTSGVGTPAQASQNIPPMQAFWVRANPGGGRLTFNNTMRSHGSGSNLLKAPAANNDQHKLLRLQVSNGTNTDEAVVYFNANASNGFDAYDSPKMSNANKAIPEIYTLAANEELVINGMNELPLNTELPLGFRTGEFNNFSIKASEFNNFDSNIRIILKDKIDKTEKDLTDETVYNFSSDVANTENRFSIILRTAGMTTDIPDFDDQVISIFGNADKKITIRCSSELIGGGTVSVYDEIGQKLEHKNIAGSTTVLSTTYSSGVYLVCVKANGKTKIQRVIIN